LLDVHLDWTGIAGLPLDSNLFLTNALNKFYWNNVTQFYNELGFASRYLGEPRMIGLRIRVRFGS
jgi:iron complex outermembrane receptor protein